MTEECYCISVLWLQATSNDHETLGLSADRAMIVVRLLHIVLPSRRDNSWDHDVI